MPRRRRLRQHFTPPKQYNSGVVDWQRGSLEEQDYQSSNEPIQSPRLTPSNFQRQHSYHSDTQEFHHSYPVQHATTASVRGRSNSRGRHSNSGGAGSSLSRSRSRSQSDTALDSNNGMSNILNMDLLTRVGNRALALSRTRNLHTASDAHERIAYADRMISFSLQNIRQASGESYNSRADASNSETSISTDVRGQGASTTPSSPISITSSGAQGSQHMPQNLRGDPFRSAKIKTELCRNFMNGRGCIFGDKCNYAHGEHELKYTTLLDLQSAGLVDVHTFRTHPCPTWVSTGSCPFDLRCPFLHDPRIGSHYASWLPHAETEVNSIDTDANVDRLYHQRARDTYSNTPFAEFLLKSRNWTFSNLNDMEHAWSDFYGFICNINFISQKKIGLDQLYQKAGPPPSFEFNHKNSDQDILEIHRVAIARELRKRKLGVSYIYRPTHIMFGELCMILQSRAFRIDESNAITSFSELINLVEVNLPTIHANLLEQEDPISVDADYEKGLVVAHEVAFGPVSDPNSKQLSICFNIPLSELSKCTPQQAKRHKRSRNRSHKKASKERALSPAFPLHSADDSNTDIDDSYRDYDSNFVPPFYESQPNDEEAFQLVSHILSLRVMQLFREDMQVNDFEMLDSLHEMEATVKMRFESQLRFWMTWAWPVTLGRDKVDENTQIPPVSGIYRFTSHFSDHSLHNKSRVSYAKFATGFVWISFVMNFLKDPFVILDKDGKHFMPHHSYLYGNLPRLPILRSLSMGQSMSSYHSFPLLSNENELKEGSQRTVKHCVCSFKTLFDFFSIVQNHYSLRNTFVDENEETIDGSTLSRSNNVLEFGSGLSDPSSWTRLPPSN